MADNKHWQLSQLCVIENIVTRTFERYTNGDASYKDLGEVSNHLGCCPLPTDVVRIFAALRRILVHLSSGTSSPK